MKELAGFLPSFLAIVVYPQSFRVPSIFVHLRPLTPNPLTLTLRR